jgi:hypothetical protein
MLLKNFIEDPTVFNASSLISIPTIYQVLQAQHGQHQTYSKTILEVISWMADRIEVVWTNLVSHGAPIEPGTNMGEEEWRRVRAITL